jgi:hypothetical protein
VPEPEWNERVRVCKQASAERDCPLDKASVDAARLAVAKSATEAKAPGEATKAQPTSPAEIKKAFLGTHNELLEAVKPCDDALKAAAKTHGQYASYDAASAAKQKCRQAATDIGHLHFGNPLPENAQKDLNDALGCFNQAYGLRSVAMGDMMKVLDAGPKPSEIAVVRDAYQFAEETWQGCSEKYDLAKLAHGFADIAPLLRAGSNKRTEHNPQ